MNRAYRLVWSQARGAWVAVQENARGRGKAGRAAVAPLLAVASALCLPLAAWGQVVPATTVVPSGGKVNAYISPNGVPVVNIDTANAAGLSHNRYTRYDVESKGLVLNNGNASLAARQSQLAGQVMANVNLNAEARVILNEVVSTRRSSLAGFTEVLGGKADVVVANPNGITCSGCGFINTDRVTLTTGTPNLGGDGSLAGFTVNRGDVLINGGGVNASAQQILDLVARSVKIDGQVNVPTLGVTTGANQWSYVSREVTGAAVPAGDTPLYAIDSSALGGMYAGRIRLIATEAGVGVRMLGEAAASAEDFTLSAAGRIEIQTKVSAQRDLALTSTAGAGDAIRLTDVDLSARRNLALTAASGGATLAGGVLVAGNNLSGVLGSLSDSGSAAAITDNNKRYAGAAFNLTTSGAAAIDGVSYGAGGALAGRFGSLAVGSRDATVYGGTTLALTATTGDLALAGAALRAAGDLSLTASRGSIRTAAGAAQGIQSTGGNVAVSAAGSFANAGILSADAGSASLRADGSIANTGTIHAASGIDIADRSGGGSETFSNSGTVLADGALGAKAAAATNSGRIQGTQGTSFAATSLTNSGTFIASATAGRSGAFTLGSLTNTGTLQSTDDLIFAVTSALANSGKLLAGGDLAIAARAAGTTLALANQAGGVIQADGLLSLQGAAGGSNTTLDTQAGILLANRLDFKLASLTNTGIVQAGSGGANLAIANGLANGGTLLSDAGLTVTAATVDNSGGIQGTQGTTVTAGSLTNSGTFIASDSSGQVGSFTLGSLSNTGTLQSADDLAFAVTGSLANSGKLLAGGDLAVTAADAGTTLALANQAGGVIQADGLLSLQGAAGGSNTTLDTQAGTLLANQFDFKLASLTNSGIVQAGSGGASLAIANGLVNSGTLLSDAGLSVTAATVDNSGGIQGTQGTILAATSLANSGTFIASATAGRSGVFTLGSLANAGTLQSTDDLIFAVTSALANSGKLLAGGDIAVTAGTFGITLALANQTGGVIQADGLLSLQGTAGGSNATLDTQAGSLLANRLDFKLASLTNSGLIQGGAAADSSVDVAGTLANASGAKLLLATDAAGGGTVAAATLTNAGTLQSQGGLAVNVGNTLDNQSGGQLISGGDLTVRGKSASPYAVIDNGRIQAGGRLDIKGYGGGNGVNVTVGGSGVLLGNTMDVNAYSFLVSNGGAVTSSGDMNLALDSLSFGGSGSRIVAATSGSGTATIALASGFSNLGAVHSSGDMNFSAPWIANTATGGFSALGTLTVNATGGDLYNAGALYAGNQLNAWASGNLTNAYATGTMDSSGSMNLAAGNTFTNNSAINASQDIVISAPTFRNEIPGGVPARLWTSIAWSPTELYNHYEAGYYNEYWYYRAYGTRSQYFASAIPAVKPQIIAGRNMSITGFSAAYNSGGVLAASNGTMTISGSGAFTNDDLNLVTESWQKQWYDWADCGLFWLDCDYYNGVDFSQWVTNTSTAYSYGAGIFAGTLNASGFALHNQSSPWAPSPTSRSATGASGGALAAGGTAVGGASAVTGTSTVSGAGGITGTTAANGAPAISFNGLVIALPSNPNGYFVTSQNPTSHYLVETNPLFDVGSNFVGSDYLAQRYGYNPDTVQKRLGDANYEAYLIRQQLIDQTGRNILKGYGDEAAQMQRLMDQAATQGKTLGLTFGQAPTAEQLAQLKESIVWMVETVVAGQKVLAPVVYLAASTRETIEGGAVIAGDDVNLDVTSLANTGGTIKGDKTLTVKSQGDITNTSGSIQGGDVSLSSTTGSIKNETVAKGSGNDINYATSIGKTAGIQATGKLDLDAAKDITVKGGQVSAGGDASLSAGGNVTFDTIENKNTTTTMGRAGGIFASGTTKTTTTTVDQVKSGLASGGNLAIRAKNDITLAGTKVKAGGDADLDAGGDLNIIARDNTRTSHTETSISGLGVGGGLVGAQQTTTDSFQSRNVGSSLDIGGNASLASGKTLTVQGSKLDVAGDAAIKADDVQVLEGRNIDRTTSKTTTTSFLSLSSGGSADSGASAGAGAGADSGAGAGAGSGRAGASAGASAGAAAGASAGASASGSAGLTLANITTTETSDYKSKAVGSELNIGGNVKVESNKSVTLRGATVNAGGDAEIDAKEVKVMAAKDVSVSTSKTTSTSIGIYVDSDNSASAGASASANAGASAGASAAASGRTGMAGANAQADASADAQAEAGAQANSATTIDLVRSTTTETSNYDLTHQGSAINAGGKLKIKAADKLTVQGSDLSGETGVSVKAKDMEFQAAEDVSIATSKTTTTRAGLYLGGNAEAKAGAGANASASAQGQASNQFLDQGGRGVSGTGSASGSAEAGASAKVGAGIYGSTSTTSTTEGSTTARVSTIRSGSGDIERVADGKITDVGTEIEAAGDFSQSATTIESRAARNTSFSSSESESHTAKVGLYGKADAGASASASSEGGGSGEAGANASVGAEMSYEFEKSRSSSASSEAVVSTIKAGGKVRSVSSDKTSLEGTQISSGGDTEIEAKELDFKAARNTETASESSTSANVSAELGLNLGSDGAVDFSASGGFGTGGKESSSSTAVVGGIQSGGKLKIKTQGDARFEGTDIAAEGDASVSAGGNLKFDAARNESRESEKSVNAEASVSLSKSHGGGESSSEKGFSASGGYSQSESSSSEAVVGGIRSGGKLELSAGKDASFEGTNIEAGGDAEIDAGGNVDFKAARNTSSSESFDVSASIELGSSSSSGAEGSSKGGSAGFSVEGGYSRERASEAVAGSIQSGGNLKIKGGKDVNFEGTDVAADGKAQVAAGGNVNFKAAESTSESVGVSASLSASGEKTTTDAKPKGGETAKGPQTETSRSGEVGIEAGYSTSTTRQGGSIKAGDGGLEISAGGDANFEGTKIESEGDAAIAAKGDVNFTTARSSEASVGVEAGHSGDSDGNSSSSFGVEGGLGVSNEGASIDAGGKLDISSGGKTTMVDTETRAAGGETIDAKGGVVRSSAQDIDLKVSRSGKAETVAPAEEEAPAEADATQAPAGLAGAALADPAKPAGADAAKTAKP